MYPFLDGTDLNGRPIPFAQVLARPHRASITAELTAPDGTSAPLAVLGGTVTVNKGAAVRRVLKLTIPPGPEGASIPAGSKDALAPFGSVIRVWYGIEVPGVASQPKWQLGEFRVSEVPIDDSGVPSLQVTAHDYSRAVAKNRLTAPWIVTAGTNYGAAILGLVGNRLPGLKARPHAVTATAPLIVVDPEQDPWDVVTGWATSFGHEVYFDNEGYLVIAPEPDPDTDPVDWTYTDGVDALLSSVSRTLTDEPGYNGVVLTSESATLTTPLRAEVWDADPASATYHLGAYGKVPKFVSSPYVATQAQADAAALAEYRRSVGGAEQLTLTAIPNPVHEVGDIIRVVRPLSKVNQTTVLESIVFPIGASGGAMALTGKTRRLQ